MLCLTAATIVPASAVTVEVKEHLNGFTWNYYFNTEGGGHHAKYDVVERPRGTFTITTSNVTSNRDAIQGRRVHGNKRVVLDTLFEHYCSKAYKINNVDAVALDTKDCHYLFLVENNKIDW